MTNLKHKQEGVLAILVISVTNLKYARDMFGSAIGQSMLMEVMRRFGLVVPANGIITYHGYSEFFVCLPNMPNISEVARIARELISALRRAPFLAGSHELSISATIGISVYPEDGLELEILQKNAGIALQEAMHASQGSFQFFDPKMNRRIMDMLSLEGALRHGIPRGELVLFYQPQIHLASGKAASCEALVRWQHPKLGMVPPVQFIPMAEKTGLILPLGDWVFAEACRQQRQWQAEGITIAVNVSAIQLQQEHFISMIETTLLTTGANPHKIELEITESALMDMNEQMMERLYRLKSFGFYLAMDDFGTGYSSLAYLKRLPISRIKLDQSFVADLPHNADSCAITTATLLMAKELKLQVVAEGVETIEHVYYLKNYDCDILQGYYYGKPMDAEKFSKWLQAFDTQSEIMPDAPLP
jgi:diguanylate cyclase (GGDEF)-like protein